MTVGGLSSFVSDVPYEGQRLGNMVPGIQRDVGDVAQLVALNAPKPMMIAGAVDGAGTDLKLAELDETFGWAKAAYRFRGKSNDLRLQATHDDSTLLRFLTR